MSASLTPNSPAGQGSASRTQPPLRYRLTRMGWGWAGVLVFLYFASLTSQSSLLLLLIGIFAGCGVVNIFVAARSVRHVDIEPPPIVHLAEGQRWHHPWAIRNRAARGASLIRIESALGTIGRIAWLAPSSSVSLLPDLAYLRRGVFHHKAIRIASTAPFGLVQVERTAQVPGEVVVHPALYETHAPRAAGYDAMVGGNHRGGGLTTTGAHFHGVRPIQPGDPLRQIHWKASAKGLGLMVKTFEEELSGRVALLLVTDPADSRQALDDAVRAAGSLVFAALDEGHHVEWKQAGVDSYLLIPPFADGGEVLDLLARAQAVTAEVTADQLQEAARHVSARGALAVVTTRWSAHLESVVQDWLVRSRVLTVYLPEQSSRPNLPRLDLRWARYTARTVEVGA